MKRLLVNQKCVVSVLLTVVILFSVQVASYGTPVSDRTPEVRDAIVAAVPGINNAEDVTEAHLAEISQLNLNRRDIKELKIGDFDGLTGLTNLNLSNNSISDLSPLSGLINMEYIYLSGNPFSEEAFRALMAEIGENLWYVDVQVPPAPANENSAPVFTEGTSTSRSVAENTASGENIGAPVAATDVNSNDTLTYTLGGPDAARFAIVSASGQLRTNSALDYETKSSYSVTVSVSDGNGGTDSIDVTINITDVYESNAPVFTEGTSTSRSVAENTASGENIGAPVAATDVNSDDILSYTLGGTDAAAFDIVLASGQLRTKAPLDYETKSSYAVTVFVNDGNSGTDSITVTINITDVDENPDVNENNAPVFTDGTSTSRSIAENTASGENIGAPVAATDVDSNDTLTYTVGGTDADSFSIVLASGQLQTKAPLDYETKSSYAVSVSVSDGNGGTDSIDVTINVTDVAEDTEVTEEPTLLDGRTQQVQDAIVAAVDGVSDAADVTEEHLAAITSLSLSNQGITSLTSGDFDGLTGLTSLDLSNNSISDISMLSGLTGLTSLDLSNNSISDISPLSGLINMEFLYLSGNSFSEEAFRELMAAIGESLWYVDVQILGGAPATGPPATSALFANYPNPSNPETWMPYQLAKPADVTISIYNVKGQLVRTLALGHQPAGVYRTRSRAAHWDGENALGERVASGLYFYTLKAGDFTATRKMLIRK